jgi:hypothetical protein
MAGQPKVPLMKRSSVWAVEELDVRRLLADLDAQPVVEEALLEPGIVEARFRQRLDFTDGGKVMDVIARQPAPVQVIGVGVEFQACPANQFLEIGIDRQIEAAEMDGAARCPARDVADVVADPGRAEIQALVGEPVMPLVEPFWRQPFGRVFILGAGKRAAAGASPTGGCREHQDGAGA